MKDYSFGRRAAQQIQKAIRKSERVNRNKQRGAPAVHKATSLICKTGAGGVPAIAGVTPGKATCDIYKIDESEELAILTDGEGHNSTVVVYNLSSSAVGASKFIQVKQETASGRMLVDFEDCEGT